MNETRSLIFPQADAGLSVFERRDGGLPKIVGYAAVFNSPTELDLYNEVVKPGAFAKTLASNADVRALVNHDAGKVLGRTRAGTLTLAENAFGLRVEINPPDTATAREIIASIRRGDVSGMSFAFQTIKDRWSQARRERDLRELLEVELLDVSIVTYPAYEDTSVTLEPIAGRSQRELIEARNSEPVIYHW